MNAPIRNVPIVGEILATCRTLQDVVDVFRLMKERLGLTNEFIDDVGGLTKGHADKILGPSEEKRLGYDTFALLTAITAVEFRVHIDLDAVKRMEAVWDARTPRWFPDAKVGRVSKKLIERAKPEIYRENARAGGNKRAANLPAKIRSQIARKAGKASGRARREKAKKARCAAAAAKQVVIAQAPSCTRYTSI